MSVMQQIRQKAVAAHKHVVLAEGAEERTVQAASKIIEQRIAKVTLVGPKAEIQAVADKFGVSLAGVCVADPATHEKTAVYAQKLFELRQAKGMTIEEATKLVTENTLYFATMMVKMGDADGMLAGAINSTGNTLRPALQIIKTAPGISAVSSCFIMDCPNT